MAATKVPFASTEPICACRTPTLTAIGEICRAPRPWIALGLGASHPDKDWPDSHWAEFPRRPAPAHSGTVFMVGGAMNSARCRISSRKKRGTPVINACDLCLTEAAAPPLVVSPIFSSARARADESGGRRRYLTPSACSTDAGAEIFKTHSRRRSAWRPFADGMRRILPAQALEQMAPYLTHTKRARDARVIRRRRRPVVNGRSWSGSNGGSPRLS